MTDARFEPRLTEMTARTTPMADAHGAEETPMLLPAPSARGQVTLGVDGEV